MKKLVGIWSEEIGKLELEINSEKMQNNDYKQTRQRRNHPNK